MTKKSAKEKVFTQYQVFIIAVLAILQFTVVLDFMVLSPLGAILLEELDISTSQFGLVVSAYAFSAGASGLLAAGFADKFDRKKLLLFFYGGFIIGTILCAMAPSYHFLLIARIVTGVFGGVMSSISFAIITDLFRLEVRGRVMGYVQMAFAGSQVLGIPIGLLFANRYGWHSPFWMIAVLGIFTAMVIFVYMKPISGHLQIKSENNVLQHLKKSISVSHYLHAYGTTTLLATGGFMLMPFASAFCIHNLGLTMEQLPVLYGVTGVFSMLFGPQIGKISDKAGKFRTFVAGSFISMIMVSVYVNLGLSPLWLVIAVNVVLFVGISSRMISASALMTAVPDAADRGAFMSINSSVQQLSGGIASAAAGLIVVQKADGLLVHYDTLGYLVIVSMIITVGMIYVLNRYVMSKKSVNAAAPIEKEAIEIA